MTIAQTSRRAVGLGNGATTAWPYTFEIPDQKYLMVLVADAAGNITSLTRAAYVVSGIGSPLGGTVTYPLAGSPLAADGSSLTIVRMVAPVQTTSMKNQGAFYPAVVEDAFDYQMMLIQQINDDTSRALRQSLVDPDTFGDLPPLASLKGKVLGFDVDTGQPIATEQVVGDATLRPDLASSTTGKGAQLVTVKGPLASEVAFPASMLNLRVVNVRTRFGVKFDGGTDDTAQWMQAGTSAGDGQILEADAGTSLVTSLVFNKTLHFQGVGRGSTAIRSNSPTADIARWNTNLPVELRNLTVQPAVTRTAGASIVVSGVGSGSYNTGSIFENINLPNAWVGLKLDNSASYTIRDLVAGGYLGAGIQVSNAAVPDAGDGTLENVQLVTQGIGVDAVGILQLSGGGLKLDNVKIIGGAAGLQLNLSAAVATSILLMNPTCSIEACTIAAILLTCTGGSTFSKAHLRGQFSIPSDAAGIVVQDNGSQWLDVLSISEHEITLGNNSIAIRLERGGRVVIGIGQIIPNGSNTTGIYLGADVGRVDIAPQGGMEGVTTPYDGPGLSNPQTFFNPPRMERGGFTGTTGSSAMGSQFVTTVQTIEFAQVFGQPPQVIANPFSAGGAAGCIINNVTRGSFDMAVLGNVASSAVSAHWTALG